MTLNGVAALAIFLMFPLLQKLFDYYMFIFFVIWLIITLVYITIKVKFFLKIFLFNYLIKIILISK
jgi:hypothetical protein